jgi:hypothetical protein
MRDLLARSDASPADSGRIYDERQYLLLLVINKHEPKYGFPKGNSNK